MIICITGKIGTGKSTVSKILSGILKAEIIDVDKVGHEVLKMEEVKEKIREAFGEDIFLGKEVDRKKLGKIVFNDERLLKKLEEIMHPIMREKIEKEVKNAKNYIIIDCALLRRMKLDHLCDLTITTTADMKTARKRKASIDEATFRKIWDMQEDVINQGITINTKKEIRELEEEVKNILRNRGGINC